MTLPERAAADVVAVHDLFVELFTGRAPDGTLAEIMAGMADDFVRVGPDAATQDKAAVEAMLAAAAGKLAANFKITVTIEEARALGAGVALVRYREDQSGRGEATSRRSTAVFVEKEGRPLWSALQETWIG